MMHSRSINHYGHMEGRQRRLKLFMERVRFMQNNTMKVVLFDRTMVALLEAGLFKSALSLLQRAYKILLRMSIILYAIVDMVS